MIHYLEFASKWGNWGRNEMRLAVTGSLLKMRDGYMGLIVLFPLFFFFYIFDIFHNKRLKNAYLNNILLMHRKKNRKTEPKIQKGEKGKGKNKHKIKNVVALGRGDRR